MTTVDRFKREYQEYHGITAYRAHEQRELVKALERYAGKAAIECQAADVQGFIATFIEAGNHPNTVRKKLNMIKPFFHWSWNVGLLDADTYLRITKIKPPDKSSTRGLPRPYKRPELDQFYRELDEAFPRLSSDREAYFWKRFGKGTSKFRAVRKHATRAQLDCIVALALQCGLRRQEIFNCTIDDIHPDNEYVVVLEGKGGKFREVPHTDASRAAVLKWIEVRHLLKPRHRSTWLSLWGTKKKNWAAPMSFFRFEKLFLKIGSGWELHRFRHTCGTEWLRSTERIELVKKLLGHSNIRETEGYAEVIRDDLARAMKKAQLDFGDRVGERVAA